MPVLIHKPISTNIDTVIYNTDHGTAAVRFHSGKTYLHSGMDQETWGRWTKDWSAGKFYLHTIARNPKKFPVLSVK